MIFLNQVDRGTRIANLPGAFPFPGNINPTDESHIEHGLFVNGFGASLAIPGRPREWGLGVSWRL